MNGRTLAQASTDRRAQAVLHCSCTTMVITRSPIIPSSTSALNAAIEGACTRFRIEHRARSPVLK